MMIMTMMRMMRMMMVMMTMTMITMILTMLELSPQGVRPLPRPGPSGGLLCQAPLDGAQDGPAEGGGGVRVQCPGGRPCGDRRGGAQQSGRHRRYEGGRLLGGHRGAGRQVVQPRPGREEHQGLR